MKWILNNCRILKILLMYNNWILLLPTLTWSNKNLLESVFLKMWRWLDIEKNMHSQQNVLEQNKLKISL